MVDLSRLKPGLEGCASLVVAEAHLAPIVGSGQIEVLASPIMAALMEAAAVDCVERLLPAGHASLGVHLNVTHVAPTPAGRRVTASAELLAIDGRKLTFRVQAHDGDEVIGRGTHSRVVVDAERFRAKLRIAG
jgi:predicted thioesterase